MFLLASRRLLWALVLPFIIGLFAYYALERNALPAQVPSLTSSSSSSSTDVCTPARILYFNLQPSLYGRDAELAEFREAKAAGFDITLANRNSIPTITKNAFDIYNVLWLHGGCAGEAFPLKEAELNVIKDFYLKGGSLIVDAGDNYAGGIYGPAGANCQDRANQVAKNLGVEFSGRVQYATSADGCRAIKADSSPLLADVGKIFRESSGEMKLLPIVAWGKTKPVFHGSIDVTGAPVFAAIQKESGHGGVIFSPQDQGMQIRCTGQTGTIYKNIFTFLGHELNCKEPESVTTTTEIPGANCQIVRKSLYGSGAVQVPCPTQTVIMGGGWNNGTSELTDYSRPLEIGQGWECHGNKEDSSGMCSAVCCDSFYYDSLVTVRDGVLNNKLTPTCPQSYSVVGGGFYDTTKIRDEDTLKPSDDLNGWQCHDDDSDTAGSRCFAVCAKRKDANDPMICKTVSTTAGQDKGTTVLCPRGSFLTGGGFDDLSSTNKDQDASMPTPNSDGWYCQKTGNKDGLTANICYARCCTLPEVTLLAALSSKNSSATAASLGVSSGTSIASSTTAPVTSSAINNASSMFSILVSPSSSSPSSETVSSFALPFSAQAPSSISSAQTSLSSSVTLPPPPASSTRPPAISSASPISASSAPAAAMTVSSSSVMSSSSYVSAPAACPPNACRNQGDAYCRMNGNLRCAEIATEPCFVCLAEIGFAQPSSSPPLSSLPLAPTVETESSLSSHATMSSLHSASSVAQTSSPVVRFTSSAPGVLPAILLTPWYPAASEAHVALGASGPGTLGVMAAGAASGLLWMRKRRK